MHLYGIDFNSTLLTRANYGYQTRNSVMNKKKTSLKIFKHYKLKPSFSIIKDDKAKDRAGVGVGDKPPPPNFGRSINPNLNQFEPFCTSWCKMVLIRNV